MKRLYLLLLILFSFVFAAVADDAKINLVYFDSDAKYAPGSGVSVVFNPTGVFQMDNTFTLELIDKDDKVVSTLKTVEEFYVPVINGVIPDDVTAGEYKIRVISSAPADTLVTSKFSVVEGSATVPTITSNLAIKQDGFVNCTDKYDLLTFGKLVLNGTETTTTIGTTKEKSITFTGDKLYMVNVKTKERSEIEKKQGVYSIPDNLSYGAYVFMTLSKNGDITSYNSALFLFASNSTTITNVSGENVCVGTEVEFTISSDITEGIGRNYYNSIYVLEFGDGSVEEFTHAQLMASPTISHMYNSVSCDRGGTFPLKISLKNKGNFKWGDKINECDNWMTNGNGTSKNINASKAPVAHFEMQSAQCVNTPIYTTNKTTLGSYGTSYCQNDPYYEWYYNSPDMEKDEFWLADDAWINSRGDLTIPASEVKTPGCWNIRLLAKNDGGGCDTQTSEEHMIMVEPYLTPTFDKSASSICKGQTIDFTNKTSYTDCESPSWFWSVKNNVGYYVYTGINFDPNSTSENVKITFSNVGNYTVILTASNSCGNKNVSTNIEVIEDATVRMRKSSLTDCVLPSADDKSKPATLPVLDFNTADIKPIYSTAPNEPVSYKWSVTGGEYEFKSASDIAYPKIEFKEFKTYKILVEIGGKCEGENSATMTYTVSKTPSFDSSITWNQTICSGGTTAETQLKADEAKTTFSWITYKDNYIYPNLYNGSGSKIPAATLTNTYTECGKLTYMVTPTLGACAGSTKNLVINVNPMPSISSKILSVCSEEPFEASFAYPDKILEGTTYSWAKPTVDESKISGAAEGNGAQKFSGTLKNLTNKAQTVSYTVTAKSPDLCGSGTSGCETTFTVTVTVNPMPSIAARDTTICNGQTFSIKPKNGGNSIVPDGTEYTWTVKSTTAEMGAKGQSTPQNAIEGHLLNKTDAQQTVIYEVTPTAGDCTGAKFNITVNVKPSVYVSAQDTTICSGTNIDKFILKGNNVIPEGVKYTWENPASEHLDKVTGYSASGGEKDYFSQGKLTNNSTETVTLVYSVKPVKSGFECEAQPFNVTVKIVPAPQIGNQLTDVCSDAEFSFKPASGPGLILPSGTTYTWGAPSVSADSITGGAASGGAQSEITGTLHNKTAETAVATYSVTPKAFGCDGVSFELRVKVNPVAQIKNKIEQTVCNDENFSITISQAHGIVPKDTKFSWSAPECPDGLTGGKAGTDQDAISGELHNITGSALKAVYTVTPTSGECDGDEFTVEVTVQPSIIATIDGGTTVCVSPGEKAKVTFSGQNGVPPYTFTYKINDGEALDVTTEASQTSVSVDADISTVGKFEYKLIGVTAGGEGACESKASGSAVIEVKEQPTASISYEGNKEICIGGTPGKLTANVTGDAVVKSYTWLLDGTVIQDADEKTYQPVKIDAIGAHTYKVIIEFETLGCAQVEAEKSIEVIDTKFELKLKPDVAKACVPFDVTFENTTVSEKPVTYNWSVAPSDGVIPQTSTSDAPKFNFTKEGEYTVSVTAANFCDTKTYETKIVAHDKLSYILDNVSGVCGEYTYIAKDLLHITGDTTTIKQVEWSVTKDGELATDIEFVVGDKNTLRPQIKIKKFGTYTVKVTIEAFCNTETVSATVTIDEPIELQLTTPDYVCANIPDEYGENPYTLQAVPAGGTWSFEEHPDWLDGDKFYPNAPGTYKLVYSVQHLTCRAEGSININVPDYPVMDIGHDVDVCAKDQEPRLLTGTPNDGVWSGTEVTTEDNVNYYFNPPLEPGSYPITYTITDANGCKNRDSKNGIVHALPNAGFNTDDFCLNDNPKVFTPEADPEVSTFLFDYGDGTQGSALSHSYDAIGVYNVKLVVTSGKGCVDSLTKELLVEKIPDQKIKVSEYSGCSVFTPDISAEYDYIDTLRTKFKWDFGDYGTDDNLQPSPIGFQTTRIDKKYIFTLSVENYCGTTVVKDSVNVEASAIAGLELGVTEGCSPVPVAIKNTSIGSDLGMHYTWDYGDGTSRSYERFPLKHTFSTDYEHDTLYTVMLIAENKCGVDTAYKQIKVYRAVIKPQIISHQQTACVGDTVCFSDMSVDVRSHSEVVTTHWDFGNGSYSDISDSSCTVYSAPGVYKIVLTDSTSCGSVESDSLFLDMFETPSITLEVGDAFCAGDTVRPKLTVKTEFKSVNWNFGDGYKSSFLQPGHAYASGGDYTMDVTVTSNNVAACKATETAKVRIIPLPSPVITPQECDSCGPVIYTPTYSDDYYTKVDYLGNGKTSTTESYTYTNHTLDPVEYYPKFYFEDEYGCKATQTGRVRVNPQPVAKFSISKIDYGNPEIIYLHNESEGADNCLWHLPYSGDVNICTDTLEKFYDNEEQEISLFVSNSYTCSDIYSLSYQPNKKGLFFPNTFIPNAVTECDRTFNGVGMGIKEYELSVYDMYGNLIFHTTSLDANGSPNEGWNGYDRDGNLMPQDVYTWEARAIFIDGSAYPYGNSQGVSDVTIHRGSVMLLHR